MRFRNREGLRDFDFTLFDGRERAGVSAMLRVKNEEKKLYYCLTSILDLFDEIVLVDNGSDDGTLEIVREFKRQRDTQGKIRVYAYPFRVARCGPENRDTPEDSVHCLSYFYNWSLSQCSFRYVCKWDADMVLRKEAREPLGELLHAIQEDEACWELPGQTVYRDLRGTDYLAKEEVNQEIMLFPYGYNPRFHKIDMCELLHAQPPLPIRTFEVVAFYELKFADEDEFSHWSTTDFPTLRKRREWESFEMLKRGEMPGSRFERLSSDVLKGE